MSEMKNDCLIPNETDGQRQRKRCNPFFRNLLISITLLIIVIASLMVWRIVRPDNKTDTHNLFNIEMISELTTLECRYHNVAVRNNKGNALGVGRQYVWFEYDVVIDVGIDINAVKIENPTEDGIVKIYLPPAKILGAAEDKATISKPVCDLGLFTELTADEERQIINDGIQKLKNDAKTQEVIFQAYSSAKNVLEQYVINVGKLIGEEYTVEWIKVPEDAQDTSDNPTTSAVE